MAKIADDLKRELEVLLMAEPEVLQTLRPAYLTGIRSKLNIENNSHIEYFRTLTIPKRDLFLQYIVNPEVVNHWRQLLQTESERKAAEEIEAKRLQDALSAQRLLHQQRMEIEAKAQADRETQERADAEVKANASTPILESEQDRAAAAAAKAHQEKMQRWHAARARTGF